MRRSPTDENFDSPPAGLILENLDDVRRNSDRVYQQTIVDQIMPLGNVTEMTDEERAAFGQWLKSDHVGGHRLAVRRPNATNPLGDTLGFALDQGAKLADHIVRNPRTWAPTPILRQRPAQVR